MSKTYIKLKDLITEYRVLNVQSLYKPVAVGKYGIRSRESIYSKELANDYSKNKLIYKGTLTIGMGSKQIDIGILSEDVIYSVSPAYHTYYINGIDFNYLRYCLECRNRDMFIRYAKRGTRQGKTINFSDWLEYEIPVHDETTQLEIVFILDKVTHTIDLCNAILEKLDMLVKSRFIELFGDPVSNPHNWDKIPLGELAEIKIGPFGTLLHKEDYIQNAHALVNPSHIIDGKIAVDMKLTVSDDKYNELSAYHLNIDDVVMGRRGEMGRCAVVSKSGLLCGTGSMIIRSNGRLKADYIQKIISFPSFKTTIEDMAVGQTMPNLNVPIVSNFMIICPPIEVQEQYYAFVEQTDKSKLAVKQVLEKAETLKKALMQEYFG